MISLKTFQPSPSSGSTGIWYRLRGRACQHNRGLTSSTRGKLASILFWRLRFTEKAAPSELDNHTLCSFKPDVEHHTRRYKKYASAYPGDLHMLSAPKRDGLRSGATGTGGKKFPVVCANSPKGSACPLSTTPHCFWTDSTTKKSKTRTVGSHSVIITEPYSLTMICKTQLTRNISSLLFLWPDLMFFIEDKVSWLLG